MPGTTFVVRVKEGVRKRSLSGGWLQRALKVTSTMRELMLYVIIIIRTSGTLQSPSNTVTIIKKPVHGLHSCLCAPYSGHLE